MPRVTCKPVQSAMSGLSMGWFLVEYVLVSDSVNETSELQFGEHWRTSESYTILYYHILSHETATHLHCRYTWLLEQKKVLQLVKPCRKQFLCHIFVVHQTGDR